MHAVVPSLIPQPTNLDPNLKRLSFFLARKSCSMTSQIVTLAKDASRNNNEKPIQVQKEHRNSLVSDEKSEIASLLNEKNGWVSNQTFASPQKNAPYACRTLLMLLPQQAAIIFVCGKESWRYCPLQAYFFMQDSKTSLRMCPFKDISVLPKRTFAQISPDLVKIGV